MEERSKQVFVQDSDSEPRTPDEMETEIGSLECMMRNEHLFW